MSEFLSPELSRKLKQDGIHLGVPLEKNTGRYLTVAIPNEPYVFFINNLLIYQGDNPLCSLKNVMAMHGHGVALGLREKDWVWKGTGKSVSDTVKMYEDVARITRLPHIDVILACRDHAGMPQSGVRVLITRRADLPYIFADSTLYQLDFPGEKRLSLGEGTKMSVMANSWIGVDRWRRFREPFQKNREIPLWAKMPAVI